MVWCTDKGLGITSEILQEISVTLEVQMNFLIFSGKKKKKSASENHSQLCEIPWPLVLSINGTNNT